MATKKDLEFITYVVDSTNSGKISWEPAAEKNTFVTSFKGKYKLTLLRAYDRDASDYYYSMKLSDENNQEMMKVYDTEDRRLIDLYAVVQRKSLRVDEALDEIMGPG